MIETADLVAITGCEHVIDPSDDRYMIDLRSGRRLARVRGAQDWPNNIPQYVTSLPASPWDGQEVYYGADPTNGVLWHLRYRAAATGSYKWDFLGGTAISSLVATQESRTNTSYGALATAGPSITLPLAGDYDIETAASMTTNAASNNSYYSYDVGGTGALDADAVTVTQDTSGGGNFLGRRVQRKTGMSASTALVAKYKCETAVIAYWMNRVMRVTPVRVG